ncbi:MAG: helix-turn-helix domain-containing protein [Anaerovoracaceae bacterium]|jgi:HTH-type transcriptional regulator/antitoxin HipB
MRNDASIHTAEEFGLTVRSRRREIGYTQQYVSEATGLSASFISDLENGKATIELGKAIFLANVLGLDLLMVPRDQRGQNHSARSRQNGA